MTFSNIFIATPITLPGADQGKTYGLDGLGNWKTSNFTLVNSDSSTTSTAEVRQHNYVNEITTIRDTTGGTPTTTPFAYDKNGNLLNDGVRIYQYDALNRLVQVNKVSGGATIASYAYDALNRRVQKTISNGGLTGDLTNQTINYLYDGQQMAMERDDDGGWTQVYFWGQYIDELLFFAVPTETVPTTYRVLSDLLYRSVAIVTTSNVVTEAYDTDAYGNTLCYSGPGTDGLWFTDDDVPTNNPINTTIFTGRQYDPESQIYYYRARYYVPTIGRFISRDPIGIRGGINLYAYVSNKAPNAVDPLGLTDCCGEIDDACYNAAMAVITSVKTIQSLIQNIAATQKNISDLNSEEVTNIASSKTLEELIDHLLEEFPKINVAAQLAQLAYDYSEQRQLSAELKEYSADLQSLQKAFNTEISNLPFRIENADTSFADLVQCVSENNESLTATLCWAIQPAYNNAKRNSNL